MHALVGGRFEVDQLDQGIDALVLDAPGHAVQGGVEAKVLAQAQPPEEAALVAVHDALPPEPHGSPWPEARRQAAASSVRLDLDGKWNGWQDVA